MQSSGSFPLRTCAHAGSSEMIRGAAKENINMKFSRTVLKILNTAVSFVVICALFVFGAYAAYALWDNEQVYAAVDDAKADMLSLKPSLEDTGPTFEELQKINPDVCAWLTLDGTEIDYPLLQGADNLAYINTDVYGNFALSGSLFLDSRNSRDFSDTVSLLYGHHMANHLMFGDLDLYKDEEFFNENSTGVLILPDRSYDLKIIACLLVPANDRYIFDPERWQAANIKDFFTHAGENALHIRSELADQLMSSEEPQVLTLSTCSYEFTDARTIILAAMEPHSGSETIGGDS